MWQRIKNNLWFVSMVLNILLGGEYPETLSSRCWRNKKKLWFRIWYRVWNRVFRSETHCVESYLETQRRKKMSEEWEQCFLPLNHPDCVRPPSTQCAYCGTVVLPEEAHKTATEDYCCREHAVAHNIDRQAQEWD